MPHPAVFSSATSPWTRATAAKILPAVPGLAADPATLDAVLDALAVADAEVSAWERRRAFYVV